VSAKRYVLDSFALLAYLQDEPGAQLVQDVLADESAKVFLCTVNLGEVYYITYYITYREQGEAEAEEALLIVEQLPIEEVVPDRELILQAARIKASFAISYADAFVAALAERRQGTIVTGDPEFKQLAHLSIKWLPSPY
jgi:predicted nucleic acid-binding protein